MGSTLWWRLSIGRRHPAGSRNRPVAIAFVAICPSYRVTRSRISRAKLAPPAIAPFPYNSKTFVRPPSPPHISDVRVYAKQRLFDL